MPNHVQYPLLEKLEEEHVSLLHERFDMIKDRRNADDEDDFCAFMGIRRELEEEETDELGRVVPKPTPALRRAARLARRQRRHHTEWAQKEYDEEEGYSTDASLPPPDLQSYRQATASLAERARQVLSDVRAEEFRDPGKGRWSAWREQYADSYVGAWGGLGVVSVWEFWVRLEIVGWDCIKVSLFALDPVLSVPNPRACRTPRAWTVSNGIRVCTRTPDRTERTWVQTAISWPRWSPPLSFPGYVNLWREACSMRTLMRACAAYWICQKK